MTEDKPIRRSTVYGGSDAGEPQAVGVAQTWDVWDVFPDGDISLLDTRRFERNPLIAWNHDWDGLPIGAATYVEYGPVDTRADGEPVKGWKIGWDWADHKHAQDVRALWDEGKLRAMSLGADVHLGWTDEGEPEIERVEMVEASVVTFPLDTHAVVAKVTAEPGLLEALKTAHAERFGERVLTAAPISRIMKLAASLTRGGENITPPEDPMADEAKTAQAEADAPEPQDAPDGVAETFTAEQVEAAKAEAVAEALAQAAAEQDAKAAVEQPEREAEPEAPGAGDEVAPERAALEAAAEPLLPSDVKLAKMTDQEIMLAALAPEMKGKQTDLTPIQVAEEFAKLVARRKAAVAALAKASETSAAVAAGWEADHGPTKKGAAQGANHPAHAKMRERLAGAYRPTANKGA